MFKMKNKLILITIIFISLFSISGYSDITIQNYNKILLNPYVVSSSKANTNITFNLNLNDTNINNVKTAIINFQVYMSPTITFKLYVNDKICNTENYTISTTYAGAGQGLITFDCTNIINSNGNYTIKLSATKDTGSLFGWIDLTYQNIPIQIKTSGTEYLPNDNATIFLKLVDGNNRNINLGSCNSTIYLPNKTKYLNAQMTLLENGIYYKDLNLTSDVGVWIIDFICNVPANIFNQNKTLNIQLSNSNPNFLDEFSFDNSNNLTINNAFIEINYVENTNGQFKMFFNGNLIFTSLVGQTTPITENITLYPSNFSISETQAYNLQFISGSSTINWIRLYVNYTSLQPQQIIRGQNEIHVRSDLNYLNDFTNQILNAIANVPVAVWSYSSRTLTSLGTFISDIAKAVWEYGGSYPTLRNTTVTNVDVVLNINSTNITLDLSNKAIMKIIEVLCFQNPIICGG